MKIIIYAQNLVPMDGVGNSSIYFMNLLKSFAEVELVANYSNIPGVLNFKEYLKEHKPNNILFYHYSIGEPNIKLLLTLKFKKKIIYYHGITPPKFFPYGSKLFNNCKKGLSDISILQDFDLYISNSSASKKQFLENLNQNYVDSKKFIIMPPINNFSNNKSYIKGRILESKIDFYYCGTINNHKNVNLLLDSFNKNTKSNFKLSIFTSSTMEESLKFLGEEKYSEYLKNRIKFFYKLEDEKMNFLTQYMNCFITLSMHEGFCIPLFDAINNFKPTLSFPLKCLEDYFPKEYKYISNLDDPVNFQKKYHHNLESIEIFRAFIKDKLEFFTKAGLDLIMKLIE